MSNKKDGKKPLKIVLVIIVSLIIGGIAGYMVYRISSPKPPEEKSQGVVGRIIDGWEDGVSEDPNAASDQSGTSIPGYSVAYMNEGDTSLELPVGNPKENEVGLIATVRLEDGTKLYESPLLKPGQGIEEIPLNQTLSKGEYNAEVYYQCVLLDEENTPLNAAISAFTLVVS